MFCYCHCKIKVEGPQVIEALRENNIPFVCMVLNTFTKPRNALFISQTSENAIHLQGFLGALNDGYTKIVVFWFCPSIFIPLYYFQRFQSGVNFCYSITTQ